MGEGIYQRRVKDIMSRDVVSLQAEDTVHEALNLLAENRVSALPVIDRRNHCVGILSTTDLVGITRDIDDDVHEIENLDTPGTRWLLDKLIHAVGHESVASYMTEDVATIDAESTLAKAAREMLRNRIHHLPVIDHREHLVGIVSTMDILAEFADGAAE